MVKNMEFKKKIMNLEKKNMKSHMKMVKDVEFRKNTINLDKYGPKLHMKMIKCKEFKYYIQKPEKSYHKQTGVLEN